MRAFISLNLSSEVKEAFAQVQAGMKEIIEPAYPGSVSWENKEKFHLTLFFLGDVTAERLDEIIKGLNRVSLLFKGSEIGFISDFLNAFPDKKRPRVLFAGLENHDNKGTALAEAIRAGMQKFGFKEEKPFHPHITLCRVRKEKRLNLNKIETGEFNIEFTCKEFYLMESNPGTSGSEYSIIETFKL